MAQKTADPLAPLAQVITAHAWNADCTMLALCPNNNEMHIYQVPNKNDTSTWEKIHVLKEHDQVITAIDWAPKTNRILTCSQDRNAFVWDYIQAEDVWKPTLVLLRINRAAICCKWSPDENKFAIGSSAKLVCICYFEDKSNWWVSKVIRKHRSTVLNIAWHPKDNTIIATACSDFRCRIFSAWVKGVDSGKGKFGELQSEYPTKCWVHDVAWSTSGNSLAFATHDSAVTFVDRNSNSTQTVAYNGLPSKTLLFLSDTALVAAGHDNSPIAFKKDAQWSYVGLVDKGDKAGGPKKTFSALNHFSNLTNFGSGADDRVLPTKHQNSINNVKVVEVQGGKVTQYSTSGLDGRVIVWKSSEIGFNF